MRIIETNMMTCNTCDTTFEYEDNELVAIMGTQYKMLVCPKCHQQIIMVPDYKEPLKERIIMEEKKMAKKKQNKRVDLIIYIICVLLLGVVLTLPTMFVGYTWVLYVTNIIELWQAIAITASVCVALSLWFVMYLGRER